MAKRNKHRQQPHVRSTATTLLDIVIPVYGRFDLLVRCLNALPAACGNISYKVILVDNNSPKDEGNELGLQYAEILDTIDSIAQTVEGREKVRLFKNKSNLGFPKACNIGARKSNSPLILFLNSDVILQPEAIFNMVKAMDNPQVGVVGAKLLFPMDVGKLDHTIRPAGKVQHVGLATNIRGDFFHVFVGWNPDHPKVLAVKEVYAVTGAALMTRRVLWDKVGGFWEEYGAGTYEDVDYSLSVRDLGYTVIVEQSAVGDHYTGATAEHYKLGYPLNQNKMLFMAKWATKLNYTELLHW